jgi:dipeptidyl aminopeptidase/acylaminoacyl peptidase
MLFPTLALLVLGSTPPELVDALSFTNREQLTSNGAGVLAWVEITEGVSNIFVGGTAKGAAAPAARTRLVADDGVVITGLRIVHPASHPAGLLLWSQGPTDAANPTSSIAPPEPRTLLSLPLSTPEEEDGGAPAVLLTGHELVTVSPDGERALYATAVSGTTDFVLCEVPTTLAAAATAAASPAVCGSAPRASLLLRIRGGGLGEGGARWSPDGGTLAVAVRRSDHGFVATWQRGVDTRLRWLAPSFDEDTSPTWSADGARLAFLRLRAGTDDARGVAGAYQQGPRFSLLVADVAEAQRAQRAQRAQEARGVQGGTQRRRRTAAATTPRVREVFRDWAVGYPGTGLNGYGARPLLWALNGSALLVGCETSGFVHVLAVDPGGDIAVGSNSSRDLTPLPCETADWALGGAAAAAGAQEGGDDADQWLFVAHNCDLVDSPGVARLRLRDPAGSRAAVWTGTAAQMGGLSGDGGAGMVALSDGGGGVSGRDGGGVAFLASGYNFSTSVFVDNDGGGGAAAGPRMLTSTAGLPAAVGAGFLPPQLVTFPSTDGLFTIHAQLFERAAAPVRDSDSDGGDGGGSGGGRPAVIFTHGGSQRQMYGAMHFSPTYAGLYALNQYLAVVGGASVLSVNYRSGVGYGRAFRLCEGGAAGDTTHRCGWQGGVEYEDVRAARTWLEATRRPSFVGIHGLSYGGLNCLQALARDSPSYAAGACSAPVFNHVTASDGPFSKSGSPLADAAWRQLAVGPEPDLNGPAWPALTNANVALAWRSSPAAFVANWTAPLLLLHGDADADVHFQESLGVLRALRRRGGDNAVIETFVLPDETHGFALFAHQVLAAEATYDFLARFLGLPSRP